MTQQPRHPRTAARGATQIDGDMQQMVASTQQRVAVLARVDQGQLTAAAAATQLALSERQVRRLVAKYRDGGALAVQHGNRGRQPAHTISSDIRERVVALAQGSAQGYSTHQISRLLAEREGLKVSRSSVRRILLAAGLPVTRST